MNSFDNDKPSQKATQARDKRILIVDDDYYFRLILEKSLTHHQHRPICAETPKHAQQRLSLEEFDLVISDIRMPEMNGVELLQWIKANFKIPVILMTGFSELLETQEAAKFGADGFLAKPFKTEELLSAISACFPSEAAKAATQEPQDEHYCKVSIDDFISGKEMHSDVYIRISAFKYIKIAHAGENLPLDQMGIYKQKGIQYLYMRREAFKKYLGFNMTLASAVTKSKSLEHQKKVNFIKHASEVLLQNLYVNEIDRESFQQAGSLVENAISIVTENPDAASLLNVLSTHTDFLYAHSVGVSLYATLIGMQLGWKSSTTVFKLSVGGLLHDIGKKEIPKEILCKTRNERTPEDVALIESHPKRGVDILAQLQFIPTEVLQIIHEHHENCLGQGYPSRLSRTMIYPPAKVVATADEFCNLVIKNPNSRGMTPAEAIKRMIEINPDYYDPASLTALMKIFNLSGAAFSHFEDETSKRKIS